MLLWLLHFRLLSARVLDAARPDNYQAGELFAPEVPRLQRIEAAGTESVRSWQVQHRRGNSLLRRSISGVRERRGNDEHSDELTSTDIPPDSFEQASGARSEEERSSQTTIRVPSAPHDEAERGTSPPSTSRPGSGLTAFPHDESSWNIAHYSHPGPQSGSVHSGLTEYQPLRPSRGSMSRSQSLSRQSTSPLGSPASFDRAHGDGVRSTSGLGGPARSLASPFEHGMQTPLPQLTQRTTSGRRGSRENGAQRPVPGTRDSSSAPSSRQAPRDPMAFLERTSSRRSRVVQDVTLGGNEQAAASQRSNGVSKPPTWRWHRSPPVSSVPFHKTDLFKMGVGTAIGASLVGAGVGVGLGLYRKNEQIIAGNNGANK